MSPMLIFLAIAAIFIAIATMATFGWRMVEKHTFSEFFVGQVIGEQKGKIPGFKQYIFSYKKRGKPNIVASRPLWRTKQLKSDGLYQIQVFHRRIKGKKAVVWAIPILKMRKESAHV